MIPVFRPLLERSDIDAVVGALEMGWLGMGSYVGEFEAAIQKITGAGDRHVVAVSTGHAALHLAFMVAGIGPGDEVITPSFNNIADFQAILAVGAIPVFCDIDERTLTIDLASAERMVTPCTKAVIAMDYDCFLADHDGVAAFAQRHGLRVIHDAAHSIGSRYKGKPVGSFSEYTMFSFDPVKTVTCVDGGILVVRTKEEFDRVREMRLVGMGQPAEVMYQNQRAWTYDVKHLGFRYHMANMHAALGLAQLAKFEEMADSRRAACRTYNARLGNIEGLRVPATDFTDVTPFLYYVRVAAGQRDAFRAALLAREIDTGIHWQPGHWFSLFRDFPRDAMTVTDRIADEIVSLPLHSKMDPGDLERVIVAIEAFFSHEAAPRDGSRSVAGAAHPAG